MRAVTGADEQILGAAKQWHYSHTGSLQTCQQVRSSRDRAHHKGTAPIPTSPSSRTSPHPRFTMQSASVMVCCKLNKRAYALATACGTLVLSHVLPPKVHCHGL